MNVGRLGHIIMFALLNRVVGHMRMEANKGWWQRNSARCHHQTATYEIENVKHIQNSYVSTDRFVTTVRASTETFCGKLESMKKVIHYDS